VASGHAAPGQALDIELRGRSVAAEVAAMPFVEPNYKRS
jgi:glycine cleavage system aminomethyltransferase T